MPPHRLAVVARPGAAQSEVRIGHICASRDTPDYHAMVLLNMILGGQFVFGPDPKFFPTLVEKHVIRFGGVVTTNYQLIVLGVAIVFMALLQYIVYGTKFGRAMRAVSFNFETASLMGIPTDRVISAGENSGRMGRCFREIRWGG